MLSSLILFLQPSARFALNVSLSVKTRSEERASEEATKTVFRGNNKGGDGSDLPSEPCQSSDSALTISSPLACLSEASLYRVEVVEIGSRDPK